MLKNLSYKQKLRLIGVVSILALFLCYQFAVSNTITEYQNYKQATRDAELLDASGRSLQVLHTKDQMLNILFNQFQLDTLHADKNLLVLVSDYCKKNDIKLKQYKPFSLSKKDSLEILTRIVTIEGNFIPCLQILYELETSGKTGRLSSADFKSFTDPTDKKTKLDCTMYIQNLISNNHEPE